MWLQWLRTREELLSLFLHPAQQEELSWPCMKHTPPSSSPTLAATRRMLAASLRLKNFGMTWPWIIRCGVLAGRIVSGHPSLPCGEGQCRAASASHGGHRHTGSSAGALSRVRVQGQG